MDITIPVELVLRDATIDATRDLPANEGPDLPPPMEAGGDALTSDASLSPAGMLYAVGSPGALGLRTASTGGLGQPQAVAGLQGGLDFDPLTLTSLITRGADPNVARPRGQGDLGGLRLPDGRGVLLYFHRKVTGTSGLLVVRADGSTKILVEVFGLYPNVIAEAVALDESGAVGAALHPPGEVYLFRTDGTALASGGQSVPLTLPAGISEILERSLTFGGGWLHGVGVTGAGERRLLRVPADGAAVAWELVSVANPEPAFIAEELARSAGGTYLALLAGASSGATDVFLLDAQMGLATNLTDNPAEHAQRGAVLGEQDAKLAVSTAGRVAFVRRTASVEELYIAEAGPSLPVQVTSDARFAPGVIRVVNLLFVDHSRLLFTAGAGAAEQDLFVWDHKSQQPANLTQPQRLMPFATGGLYRPQGAWLDRARSRINLLAEDSGGLQTVVLEVALGSSPLVARVVFAGGVIPKEHRALIDCGSRLLFLAADPSSNRRAIWQLARGAGDVSASALVAPPTKGPWVMTNLSVNPGCSSLLWTAGGASTLTALWRLDLGTTGASPAQLTAVPRYFAEPAMITADGATAIFASGGAEDTLNLRAIPLAGGPARIVDPLAGQIYVLAVF